MKFKEFAKWCNNRACDGCWSTTEAMICIDIGKEIYELPFWKREKTWRECHESKIVEEIVNPTNQKIRERVNEECKYNGCS